MSVTFDAVNKQFGDVRAVKDLRLEVNDGEFLVLVGPSGCGKTTALRMVAGLETPTSGEIYIAGVNVTNVEPSKRDIAMVFQSYALYPHMNVYDNLAFGLKQRKTPKDEIARRVEEAAAMLAMSELLNRRPKELSGGQRQRVALGRAIVRRPRVFLMDEPLSNLDAQLRLKTRAEISSLHRRLETTFIYVTHDQVEAMTMGTRIAVMRDGILQQVAEPQELYENPANTFVATFIGSPSMNLLQGEIVRTGETVAFMSKGVVLQLPADAARTAEAGAAMTIGIRPEEFARRPTSAGSEGIAGRAVLVEPHGSDMFVTIQADCGEVTARLEPNLGIRVGDHLAVAPLMDRVHCFSAVDGRRL